jgi:hypothetical protein
VKLLQPHEGITGTQRDETDPLLTPEGSALACDLVQTMWRLAMSWHEPGTYGYRTFQRMQHPVAGDRVVVYDAIYRRNPDDRTMGVGYLVASRKEWADIDAEWAKAIKEDPSLTERERWTDTGWYVQYMHNPEAVCRWTNCTVLAIPTGVEWP